MVLLTVDLMIHFECFKAYHVGFSEMNSIKAMIFLAANFYFLCCVPTDTVNEKSLYCETH